MLWEACSRKANKVIRRLTKAEKDTYEHLMAALKSNYGLNVSDKARALVKSEKLKQKSGESLRAYAKRAKKISTKFDTDYDYIIAQHQAYSNADDGGSPRPVVGGAIQVDRCVPVGQGACQD
jgi:hypothetical protein